MIYCMCAHHAPLFSDPIQPPHKKAILQVIGYPTVAYLILSKDTNIRDAFPQVKDILNKCIIDPYAIPEPDTTRSSRVCGLVKDTQEFEDVAIISAEDRAITSMQIVNINDNSMKRITQQLCKDFWNDAWFDVWDKHPRDGLDAQGAMCRRGATPPDSNMFTHTYHDAFQGVLCNHLKYPDGNISAIVVDAFTVNFKEPHYVAYYTLLYHSPMHAICFVSQ